MISRRFQRLAQILFTDLKYLCRQSAKICEICGKKIFSGNIKCQKTAPGL